MNSSRLLSSIAKSLTHRHRLNLEQKFLANCITSRKTSANRLFHTTFKNYNDPKSESGKENEETNKESESEQKKEEPTLKSTKALMTPFDHMKTKEKETFLEVVRKYEQRLGPKTDVVKFVTIALKYMDEFGVNKDLAVYKALLNVFPKGPYVPETTLQIIFFAYLKEQRCAVEVLDKMEMNGVCPDPETELILLNTFGKWGMPVMKCHRLAYWLPKFKHASPWVVPKPLPTDPFELAMHIIKRITSVDLETVVKVYRTEDVEDALEKTWIVSAMAPKQALLIQNHGCNRPLFVEGPFKTWLGDKNLNYFMLRAKPPPEGYIMPDQDPDDVSNIRNPYLEPDLSYIIPYPSVHEQKDGIIMAICATGTSTKDSLLSWIRCLQKEHPALESIPIVFTLRTAGDEQKYIENSEENSDESMRAISDNR